MFSSFVLSWLEACFLWTLTEPQACREDAEETQTHCVLCFSKNYRNIKHLFWRWSRFSSLSSSLQQISAGQDVSRTEVVSVALTLGYSCLITTSRPQTRLLHFFVAQFETFSLSMIFVFCAWLTHHIMLFSVTQFIKHWDSLSPGNTSPLISYSTAHNLTN